MQKKKFKYLTPLRRTLDYHVQKLRSHVNQGLLYVDSIKKITSSGTDRGSKVHVPRLTDK